MDFVHVGLVSRSEADAHRFFGEVLGLPMTRRSRLPREVATGLFGIDQECELLYYGAGSLVFEVFVTGWSERSERRISHTCLEVEDRAALIARCHEHGFEVRQVTKGDKVIVFVADADGNLFEVKA